MYPEFLSPNTSRLGIKVFAETKNNISPPNASPLPIKQRDFGIGSRRKGGGGAFTLNRLLNKQFFIYSFLIFVGNGCDISDIKSCTPCETYSDNEDKIVPLLTLYQQWIIRPSKFYPFLLATDR